MGPDDVAMVRRCTCGVFEHEWARLRASGLSEEGARRFETLRRRYGNEGPSISDHHSDAMFIDDPHAPEETEAEDPTTISAADHSAINLPMCAHARRRNRTK
jgi:hypothetical protein